MPPLSHNGKVALAYAKAALFVFPCSAERKKREPGDRLPFGKADKRPLVSSWSKEASKDEKQIQQWWTEHPEALVGLPCKQNRLFVVDTDRHTNEQDGVAQFATLCEGRDEPMLPHPIICTDYEGEHHAFRMPDEPIGQGKNKLPPGCRYSRVSP
jgi:putative DNA primase/helicase